MAGVGGAGGGLAYKNNIAVTPGTNYTVVVGAGSAAGLSASSSPAVPGGDSTFNGTTVVAAGGGSSTTQVGDVTQVGGAGAGTQLGGGGAAGYSAAGGSGWYWFYDTELLQVYPEAATYPSASSASGGYVPDLYTVMPADTTTEYSGAGGGGGVGLLGAGAQGTSFQTIGYGGGGGSGGMTGYSAVTAQGTTGGAGGAYGGGGGGGAVRVSDSAGILLQMPGGAGGSGAVRIIWGAGRSYPNNAANVGITPPNDNYYYKTLLGSSAPYLETNVTSLPTTNFANQVTSGVQILSNVLNDLNLRPQTDFTITAWVRPSDVTSSSGVIFDVPYTDHSPPFYSLHLRTGSGKVFFGFNSGGTYQFLDAPASASVPLVGPGQWHHVAAVYSLTNGFIRTYVDGVLHNSRTTTGLGAITYYAMPVTVGRAPNWSTAYAGNVGWVKLYKDVAFSANQVLAEVNAGFFG